MSAFGISEFEDSLWDEFFRLDQMVPNDGLECSNDHFPWHDSFRNTFSEVNRKSTHSEDASVSRCAHPCRKQGGCSGLHDKCSSISDIASWSCKRSAMFPESDLMDETSSVAFDDARPSCHAFKINSADSQGGDFPENGTYLGDRRAPVDNQSETTQQESSFSSLENIDSTDFFSGICPDIQSFEEVEKMFRSPDSTFGVGVHKDELSWLSPDNDEGGSRSEFPCPKSNTDANMSEDRDSSKSYSADNSVMARAPMKFNDSSCVLEKSDSDIPLVNVPALGDNKDGFIPRDESVGINDTPPASISTNSHSKSNSGGAIHELKKQFKPLNQLKKIRKEHNSGRGSCSYTSNLPSKGIKLHSAATSYEDPSAHLQQQQKQALGLLNHMSSAPLEKSHFPYQTSANQPPSAVKCKGIKEREKRDNNQSNRSYVNESREDANIVGQAYESDSPSVGMQVHLCGDKFEDTIDADGVSLVNPAKLGSSIEQESKTQSLDEISPEVASFCQLQLVMEWLDFRTRLSIRDGLYRLARGAEQRHNHADMRCSSGDGKTSSGLLIAGGTNKCTNFPYMEAGTNPIDRSIAHLLFHRPSDSCAIPAHDSNFCS